MAEGWSDAAPPERAGVFDPAAELAGRCAGADDLAEPGGDFAININTSTGNHSSPAAATQARDESWPGRRPSERGSTSRRESRRARRGQAQYSNWTADRVSRIGRTTEAMKA